MENEPVGHGWDGWAARARESLLTHTPQVDGKQKVMFALTQIKGVGRRYSNLVCKKADVDLNKRYGISREYHTPSHEY